MSVRAYFSVSLSLHVLLTVPHSTCRVYSLFIDQCVAVLHTCVGSVSVIVSFLHLRVAGGARSPSPGAGVAAYMLILLPAASGAAR